MEIKQLFNEEITREVDVLRSMTIGSEEYKAAVDGITKLTVQMNEMERIQMESTGTVDKRKDDKKDRVIQYCIKGVEIAVPAALAVWGTVVSFKYDDKGVVPTTIMGKGFLNKLIPKK